MGKKKITMPSKSLNFLFVITYILQLQKIFLQQIDRDRRGRRGGRVKVTGDVDFFQTT